jgi:hypothetical protein
LHPFEGDLEVASGPKTTFFGKPRYVHTLTIRFVDQASGRQVYKVAATTADDNEDAVQTTPYLVRTALDKFPSIMGRRCGCS